MPDTLPAVAERVTDERGLVPAMHPDGFATAHPVAVYLKSLKSPSSQRTMGRSLDRLAELLTGQPGTPAAAISWHTLRPDQSTYLVAELISRYAPSTARKMMSALSGVLKQCWRLGLLTRDEHDRLTDWGKITGTRLAGAAAGRHVERGEALALFAVCSADPQHNRGVRDAALLTVLYGGGLRRAEVVGLDLDDYDPDTGAFTVRGKGDKERLVYCTNGGCDAMAAWLKVRGTAPGPLFLAVNKGDRIDPTYRRLTTQAVYNIVQRIAATAKVRRFSPHDMRRTLAGDLLDAGADLSTVQQILGHARVDTTGLYDRRGERAKRAASNMIHVPYVAPAWLTEEDVR